MKRFVCCLLLVGFTAAPVAAECGLIKAILKCRLQNLERREGRLRDILNPPSPGPRMEYSYSDGYQSMQYSYQAAAPVSYGSVGVSSFYQAAPVVQTVAPVVTQSYGSVGNIPAGFQSVLVQSAPATSIFSYGCQGQ